MKIVPLIALNNFEKKKKPLQFSQQLQKRSENDFLDIENGEITDVNFFKSAYFLSNFLIYKLYFASLVLEK